MEIPSDIDDLDWPGLLLYLVGRKVPIGRALDQVALIRQLLVALRRLNDPVMTAEFVERQPKLLAVLGLIDTH